VKEISFTKQPLRVKTFVAAFCLSLICFLVVTSQQTNKTRTLLNVQLGSEVVSWLNEVEKKLGNKIYAEYAELDEVDSESDYVFGTSYITAKGVAVLQVDESFFGQDKKKTEAVIAHELLHLRLRVRGYPQFLFSSTVKTKKGLAQDVEQSNVNDLVSMIEHKIFKSEMQRSGFDKLIDLTNGLEAARYADYTDDGQADTLNYTRAVLEWNNPKLLEEYTKIYKAKGWTRSFESGKKIAEIIRTSTINSPNDVPPVFLRCMRVLYQAEFTVKSDKSFALTKVYPQMLIYASRLKPRSR